MLCLLGEVAVYVDRRPVGLGHAKQRCLLAVLAVDVDRVVPVDRLIEQVWGVDLPLRARATLHGYISRLRRALAQTEGLAIERRSGGYTLTADPTRPLVDLHRFRELCARAREQTDDAHATRLLIEALELWRGQALTGLYGEWAEIERERLERERLAAQHELADTRLRLGEGRDLVIELAARAAAYPLDERVAGQYMWALHQAGRTSDALRHYGQVRERLVEELGTDPGAALQDLYQRTLAVDPALTGAPVSTAVASVTVPRQLPAPPAPFVGRHDELDRLDDALYDNPAATVIITALAGTGGIGKTWLALHWAHRHLDRFPDGQLFVDLRGFSPEDTPMDAAVAMRGFLDALGVAPGDAPVDPHARAALFRSLVADKRMLLVLDNAVDTTQVIPFLPGGTTCTVVVTSRNRLPALSTRYGGRPMHIDVLPDTEARTLLDAALGDTRTSVDAERAISELIALCRGLPLALGLIAACIRASPDLLDDVVTELRELGLDALDSDDPTASLPTVLSWSLRYLTEQQRTTFALLGTAPGPDIGLPAATHLTGLPVKETHTLLRNLSDASLITRTPGGRYAMHDLVRAFASTLARDLLEPVQETALRRVLDFYVHTARVAARLLYPYRRLLRTDPPARAHPLPDVPAALDWFDAEHLQLFAAVRTAYARGQHDAAWQLAWALSPYLSRRGYHHDHLAVWQTALDATAHLSNAVTRLIAHRILGVAHAELGHHQDAVGHLQRALTLAEQHQEPTEQGHTHRMFAFAWMLHGDDRRALDHATAARRLHQALDQPMWEAEALDAMGWYEACLGDYNTARTHCEAALALHRRHHDPIGEANALDGLGWIAHHTGHHHQAIHHYERALTLYRSHGSTCASADVLDHLGHPHAALDQHAQARTLWQEALKLYQQQGRDNDTARMQRQLHDHDQPSQHTKTSN